MSKFSGTRDTGASEPVGTLHAIVLDVNDLESCAGFWSEVLGKEISFKTDKYSRIGGDDDTPSFQDSLFLNKRRRASTSTRKNIRFRDSGSVDFVANKIMKKLTQK
jgi:hypothetical protein